MLTPAHSSIPAKRAAAARRAAAAVAGSSEADVNFLKWLSSRLFKVAYVIRDSLSQASDGPVP